MLKGIDISNWQRNIDVSATDADFVIVKASEGVNWYDPSYKRLADATLACGKLLGFYHFARQNNWKDEADTFLAAVEPYIGRCILALDFEADAVDNGPSWAEMWMDYVYEKTGVKPIIYMSKSVTRGYDWSSVAEKYALWGAQYADILPHGWIDDPWTDSYPWGAWGDGYPLIFQYSSVGGIQGYSGNLDKNISSATVNEWLEMEGADMAITNDEFDRIFYDNWGYKNFDINGDKDAYQLLTDAANNSEKAAEALKNAVTPVIDYDKLASAIAPKIGDIIATNVVDKLAARLKE